MARDSSGTYTLPAGNPVSSGQTISSTTHNNTMSDVASEMTDSLSRSGKGPMTAALELANGTVAAPALSFDSDTDCGLYRIGANNPAIAAGGAKAQEWATTGSTLPLGVTVTQSQADTGAVTATGNGTGAGVTSTGGTTGAGVVGNGGATSGRGGIFTGSGTSAGVRGVGGGTSGNGVEGLGGASNGNGGDLTGDGTGFGVRGTGGDSSGTGVVGVGGATNGKGGTFTGTGSGNGMEATTAAGTGYGAYLTGNATRSPLIITPSAAPSAIDDGALYVNSSTGKLYVGFSGAWVLVGGQS